MDKKRVSGQTVSRSGMVKTSSIAGKVPWVFTVEMSPGLRYTDAGVREFLSLLDHDGLRSVQSIEIGASNTGLSWLTEYRGDLSVAQRAQLLCHADNANNVSELTVRVASVTGSSPTDYLVRAGDLIQPGGNYKYPYIVTQDVLIGDVTQTANYQVNVPVNRSIIQQSGYTWSQSDPVYVGSDVTWQVKLMEAPSYSINPDRLVEWNSPLIFMEYIED